MRRNQPIGETLPVLALSATGSGWWKVRLPNGREGWAAASVIRVTGDTSRLPREFPPAVLAAAEQVPDDPPAEQGAGRHDLRRHTTVTIDPEDAKDFDDALSFYRDQDSGRRVVLVHIADLSFYVQPGDPIDREAHSRGCSVYLASDVVPMLPPRQSKEVFSVVPGRDRLAKTVVLEFDEAGELPYSGPEIEP